MTNPSNPNRILPRSSVLTAVDVRLTHRSGSGGESFVLELESPDGDFEVQVPLTCEQVGLMIRGTYANRAEAVVVNAERIGKRLVTTRTIKLTPPDGSSYPTNRDAAREAAMADAIGLAEGDEFVRYVNAEQRGWIAAFCRVVDESEVTE